MTHSYRSRPSSMIGKRKRNVSYTHSNTRMTTRYRSSKEKREREKCEKSFFHSMTIMTSRKSEAKRMSDEQRLQWDTERTREKKRK